ncbi:nucleotidyl transferase AbiEii/AbiGii toxin family protein (plasmid) [Chlorobium phaeovibrioides]|uniref:Nucleotidyl transferase AbiEii/AbiGii toxin family protein n=1 Tax=Chlorobium phaeovibrioides TaxID=1094 RepID=A0A5M8I4S3_CHLPH|nr:nucleotidyl transferase AbiEii/AbiGii toxin family protein [Chlorobium phaeovibrioides]KAA6230393.1 nucleotidyl transferase AbiEii/AbiGii toxin family protein [Chlorobium phaeovibrioides]
MINPLYKKQVDLLLRVLPHVAQAPVFALKGGTAINLFEQNMPRLSVDIDLVYLPLDDRAVALESIASALQEICKSIEKIGIKATPQRQRNQQESKVICTDEETQIKIEVNTIIRGHLFPVRVMDVQEIVVDTFEKFASMRVLSREELYGGKICAALDRQHPRDLFDVNQLFELEGISDEIRTGFLCMLLCHPRPMNELLQPHFIDQEELFAQQFFGMTEQTFGYGDYDSTRHRLIRVLHEQLAEHEKNFLLSFKFGEPQWSLFPVEKLEQMPATRWKLQNIRKLKHENPGKHSEQLKKLEKSFL